MNKTYQGDCCYCKTEILKDVIDNDFEWKTALLEILCKHLNTGLLKYILNQPFKHSKNRRKYIYIFAVLRLIIYILKQLEVKRQNNVCLLASRYDIFFTFSGNDRTFS